MTSLPRVGSEADRLSPPRIESTRLLARPIFAPILAIAATVVSFLFLHGMHLLIGPSMPLLAMVVVTGIVAFYGSGLAAGLTVLGLLILFTIDHLLAPSFSREYCVRIIEASAVGGGAAWFGCRTRVIQEQQAQHLRERAGWLAIMEGFHAHQRLYLRDVLAQVTGGRLRLCESSKDLPIPLPFAPNESALSLASATLGEVRERIRQAAQYVRLSEKATGELVIAASEAALNAVVHASGGTAEVRAAGEAQVVQVWISDKGHGIEDTLLHRATLEQGYSSKGTLGQGFSLMLHTCSRIYLLTGKTGTTIVIEVSTADIA